MRKYPAILGKGNTMNIQQLEREIFWNEHVAATTKDPKQKARCEARVLRFMQDIADIKRAAADAALERGTTQHAAWYDASAELA